MEKYILILNLLSVCLFGTLVFSLCKKIITFFEGFPRSEDDHKLYNMFIEKKIESFDSKINDLIQLQVRKESANSIKKEPRIKRKYIRKIKVQP